MTCRTFVSHGYRLEDNAAGCNPGAVNGGSSSDSNIKRNIQHCLATGEKLGRPRFAWDVPARWAVPAQPGLSHMAGLSQFTAGLSHLAGLSQFPAGLSHLVGVSQFDLGHVTSHVLTYADVPHLCFCRYGGPAAQYRKYNVQGTPSYDLCAAARVCLIARRVSHLR